MFRSIFNQVVGQVYETEADVENKQYLLATGQLDDAHSLPIAEAKAALSLDVMISLRNKVLESYNELIKMNV
jgi:flagellar hook-basal body complex protein FliE